jgi:preflagellin peptidase FlaK
VLAVDALRILAGASILTFAAACDIKWRRAPDAAWGVMAGIGAVLLGVQAWLEPAFVATYLPSLLTAGIVAVLAIVGYLGGLIAGGADAKALVSLSILAPVPLDVVWTVPLESILPLVVTAIANGLVVGLAVPIALLFVNLARGDVDGWRTLLATRVPTENVRERVTWPLEYVDEGELVTVTMPGNVPVDGFDRDAVLDAGRERVWVSPKIPFLVPLTFGFAISVILGDPLAAGLGLLLA